MIRSEQNMGFTGGNNLGIEQALVDDPDYLFFLNNDTVVSSEFLFPLLECLASDSTIVAVQPQICFYPEQERIWNAGNLFYPLISHTTVCGYGMRFKESASTCNTQSWLTGCAILAKASLFKAPLHLRFNNHFFALYEDVDLSFRIRKLGGKLSYVPHSRIYHRAGYSSNTRKKEKEGFTHPFMVFLNCRNRIWLARLYTPWYFMPTTIIFLTGYFLLLVPYFLVRGRIKKAFLVIKAIKEGILNSPV
jgi:GT2 family glycosyltransferase